MIKVALAGDTMLGRGVAERLRSHPADPLVAPEVIEAIGEADLFVLNLECCISDRGTPWPRLGKPFFFRAPPAAVETLGHLGVDCVTLANNHALDFGDDAMLDTLEHLQGGGIKWVGAGSNVERARQPIVLEANGFRLAVIGFSDHPDDFAATDERAGIAFADLKDGVPDWILESIKGTEADAVLVIPHWGPNMTPRPVRRVREAAAVISATRATVVAGHSAHVFQGVEGPVLYDLGDFIDDYAVDAGLRNDLGLLFLVDLDQSGPVRMEAVPLKLDYCFTRMAREDDAEWIEHRLREACAEFGTEVTTRDDRLVVKWR